METNNETQNGYLVMFDDLPVNVTKNGLDTVMGIFFSQTINDKDLLKKFYFDDKNRSLEERIFRTVVMAVTNSMNTLDLEDKQKLQEEPQTNTPDDKKCQKSCESCVCKK